MKIAVFLIKAAELDISDALNWFDKFLPFFMAEVNEIVDQWASFVIDPEAKLHIKKKIRKLKLNYGRLLPDELVEDMNMLTEDLADDPNYQESFEWLWKTSKSTNSI